MGEFIRAMWHAREDNDEYRLHTVERDARENNEKGRSAGDFVEKGND